jgi:hypothetical protein
MDQEGSPGQEKQRTLTTVACLAETADEPCVLVVEVVQSAGIAALEYRLTR